jgi:hypothetical protein
MSDGTGNTKVIDLVKSKATHGRKAQESGVAAAVSLGRASEATAAERRG